MSEVLLRAHVSSTGPALGWETPRPLVAGLEVAVTGESIGERQAFVVMDKFRLDKQRKRSSMRLLTSVFAAVVALGVLIAAGDPRPVLHDATQEGDEKTIRALLRELEEKWNQHEMEAFSARLAENADVVNRFGQWMKGRAAILEHLVGLHKSPFRAQLESRSSKIEQVRFLTPDVALAHELTEERTGKSVRTYVLQKRDGHWWIESADITQLGQAPHP